MIIFYVIGILYLIFTGFSWFWYLDMGRIEDCTTQTGRLIFRHAEISALVLVSFVIWTFSHAAGHIMSHSLTQGW